MDNNNGQQTKSNSDLIPEEDKRGNDQGMNESMDRHEGETDNGELGGNFGTGESETTKQEKAEENINTSHA
jgi:hypothetical protein